MLFEDFPIFSSGSHFAQLRGTTWAILVMGHKKTIDVKLFYNQAIGLGECCLKIFLFFGSGRHFVKPSRTILAILVKGGKRNILWNNFEIGTLT